VAVILFVIAAGLTQAHTSYMRPFAPFGVRGIFDGATTAFFAYIGADALANTAEEARPSLFPLLSFSPFAHLKHSVGCPRRDSSLLPDARGQ
jgi:hypothetical protein